MTGLKEFEATLDLTFEKAVAHTREVLKTEGFGILTEIDLQAAFREKLGAEFRPYVILGACNPPLAFAAVTADPAIGLMLPCNVTVEAASEGTSIVRMTDPAVLLGSMSGTVSAELQRVGEDARARLARAMDELRKRR